MSTVAAVQPKVFIQPNETTSRNKALRVVAAVAMVAGLAIAAAALLFAAQLSVVGIGVGVAISLLASFSFSYLRSIDGDGKLHDAAFDSNRCMVKFLLCLGANPNAQNHSSDAPLHVAALKENPQIIKDLIAAGGNVTGFTPIYRFDPLHQAVYLLNVESATVLLENGADPDLIPTCVEAGSTLYKWVLAEQKKYKNPGYDLSSGTDERTREDRVAATDRLVELLKPRART